MYGNKLHVFNIFLGDALKTLKAKIVVNVFSSILPLLVAFLSVPLLIKAVGLERFSLLTIVWMIVGYFSLLDMGLGRALTQRVSVQIGLNETNFLYKLVLKSVCIVFLLTSAGGACIWFLSNLIASNYFDVSEEIKKEVEWGIRWVALTIPLAVMTTVLLGVLEGMQYFFWIAVIRTPLSILVTLSPLLSTFIDVDFSYMTFSIFFVRICFFCIFLIFVFRVLYKLGRNNPSKSDFTSLFKFGGWMSLSNIISPLMVYGDRFYVSAIMPVSIVAYYTTPFDLLTKMLVVPFSIISVMFPNFSGKWVSERKEFRVMYCKTFSFIFLLMLIGCSVFYFISERFFSIWISEEFSYHSHEIASVLVVGVFFNSIAMLPFSLIQSVGRSDITAKVHFFELPIYCFSLYILLDCYGLIGAAYAWVLRVFMDFLILNYISLKYLKKQ